MGAIIQKNNRLSIVRILLTVILLLFLILPGVYGLEFSSKNSSHSDQKIVSKISRQIEIPADSDYYIKFFSDNLTLVGQEIEPYSLGLSEKVKSAIAKSPNWVQRELTRQFQSLDEPEEYAGITHFMTKEEFESLDEYDPNYWKREKALLIKFEILEPKPTVVKFRL